MNKQQFLIRCGDAYDELYEILVKTIQPGSISALQLEKSNFRIDSTGWKRIKVERETYLENPRGDVWEIITGCTGEQLFTTEAGIRETALVGLRIPTDEEWDILLKTKENIANIVFTGYRSQFGWFYLRHFRAYYLSSTVFGDSAWMRYLLADNSTVYRFANDKEMGCSVRCLKP